MSITAARGLLACPLCRRLLQIEPTVLRCGSGHAFDVARQGYVNLLLGAQPAHADTPAMVQARSRVLASGLFEPLAEAVAQAAGGASVIVEAGAGTAYYLTRALTANPDARGVAVDVSVAAARAAARAHPQVAAVVADVWAGLPMPDASVDAVLAVFAPRNVAEFARVLRPGGTLVVATPTPAHLAALRERHGLLDIPADKEAQLHATTAGLFTPASRVVVEASAHLDADGVRDLVAMGPNAFHGVPAQVEPATVQVSVTVTSVRLG